jgi:hypothetical protein
LTSASLECLGEVADLRIFLELASCPLAGADVVPGESKVARDSRGVVHLHQMRGFARGLKVSASTTAMIWPSCAISGDFSGWMVVEA